MPIGYTRAPRVTGSNQESRTRRLSRSLTTGNNGTPMVFTLFSTEEQKVDASPVAANTAAQRAATRWFSTEFAANSAVDIGYWQNAGYISLNLMNTGAVYFAISYASLGTAGANAVLFMNSSSYMSGDATKLSFDAANSAFALTSDVTGSTRGFRIGQHNDGAQGALMRGYKSRGTSAAPTSVANGDYCIFFGNYWYDGATYRASGGFGFSLDGTPSSGVTPSRLDFITTSTSAGAPSGFGTSRITVRASGNVGINETDPLGSLHATSHDAGTILYLKAHPSQTGDYWRAINSSNTVIANLSKDSLLQLNPNDTGSAHFILNQQGTGDSATTWRVTGASATAGIDNSDSDRWKLSMSNTLGTTDAMRVNTYPSVNFPTHASAQKMTIGGSTVRPRDSFYVAEVTHTVNTGEIARGSLTLLPSLAVVANGDYYLYGSQTTVGSGSHNIATGITDTGDRIGFTAECYSTGADFAGTLTRQIGCQVRYGQGSAAVTGTISNSVGLQLQAYKLAGTITQQWGVFQENVGSANAVNLFNGYTRISPGLTNPPVHLFELIANDTVTNGTMRVYQVSTGDASIQFSIGGIASWAIGIDNSDSDKFKICAATDLGGSTQMAMNSSGFSFGTDTITYPFNVLGDIAGYSCWLRTGTGFAGVLIGGESADYAIIGAINNALDTWKTLALQASGGAVSIGRAATALSTLDVNGSLSMAITTVSANTTLNTTHHTVLVNAATAGITITLPTAASANSRIYRIKKIDSSANTVTIDGNGTEKIDGANTVTLSAQWNARTIQSDGSAWYIIATV